MERIKTYKLNPLLASVITLMVVTGTLSIDIEKLLRFYTDPQLSILIFISFIVIPAGLFFGFNIKLFNDRIVYRHNMFFRKIFKISDLSHVLYQPTWRGVTPMNSQTNMRSLHIVRGAGGWRETISLANGAFREEDLADISKRLRKINPKIEIDEQTMALIKKYESVL